MIIEKTVHGSAAPHPQKYFPCLYKLASRSRHVALFGTRLGHVATALLFAQPDVLFCYDIFKHAQLDRLRALAGRTFFRMRVANVRQAVIEPTELLVTDTRHDSNQLRAELERHACRVRRWIVVLGTSDHSRRGESAGDPGLEGVLEQFVAAGAFRERERREVKYGLTILEAIR